MKKYFWIILVLAAVVGLLWWGNEHVKQPSVEFLPMICAEDEFYCETEQLISVLPEGWTELGEITETFPNTQELPRCHLVSNCCGVGAKVYAPPRESREEVYAGLYALQENGAYRYYEFLFTGSCEVDRIGTAGRAPAVLSCHFHLWRV